ncbi:MAG: lectin-like protein [Planctomycetota bacterium]|nr:lectin-like protein [Planctomycetota bacterium]
MRYLIPCSLLAFSTRLYVDEPKSKAIRKYENEVEVLRKQGQAAVKRLEGVFEKEVEKLRAKTLKDLQKELHGALEAKDLDKAAALREAIKAFADADEAGLSAKSDAEGKAEPASKKKMQKRIPRDALTFCRSRYAFIRQPRTWHRATKNAADLGGHLVTSNSVEEYDFLQKVLHLANDSKYSYWIGGTCEDDGTTYRDHMENFIDFTPMRNERLTNNTYSHCWLHLGNNNGWRVKNFSHGIDAFIIEWDN